MVSAGDRVFGSEWSLFSFKFTLLLSYRFILLYRFKQTIQRIIFIDFNRIQNNSFLRLIWLILIRVVKRLLAMNAAQLLTGMAVEGYLPLKVDFVLDLIDAIFIFHILFKLKGRSMITVGICVIYQYIHIFVFRLLDRYFLIFTLKSFIFNNRSIIFIANIIQIIKSLLIGFIVIVDIYTFWICSL